MSQLDLDQFDQLRLEDPQACLAKMSAYETKALDLKGRVRFLAILGAVYRRRLMIREATHALNGALELALSDESLFSEQADVYLKLAHLEYEKGRPYRALRLNERALALFEIAANSKGLSSTLLDRAMWEFASGRLCACEASLLAAQSKIQVSDALNRYRLYLGLASVYEATGRCTLAEEELKKGQNLACKVGKTLRPPVFLISGKLKKSKELYNTAAEEFKIAGDLYFEVGQIVDAAFAALEQLEALILAKRPLEACLSARSMAKLLEPLSKLSPLAEVAILKLIKIALQGNRLSMVSLEEVKRSLKAKR